jgi:hypothetical protein
LVSHPNKQVINLRHIKTQIAANFYEFMPFPSQSECSPQKFFARNAHKRQIGRQKRKNSLKIKNEAVFFGDDRNSIAQGTHLATARLIPY